MDATTAVYYGSIQQGLVFLKDSPYLHVQPVTSARATDWQKENDENPCLIQKQNDKTSRQ